MMPDVDGIELLRHIRSDEAFNSMPVVSESPNALLGLTIVYRTSLACCDATYAL